MTEWEIIVDFHASLSNYLCGLKFFIITNHYFIGDNTICLLYVLWDVFLVNLFPTIIII